MATQTEAKRPVPALAVEIDDATLTLNFSHGEALTLKLEQLSPAIRHAAMMHGLKQKLVDAAAIARNPDTGRSATIDDKYAAVREVYDRITAPNGTWNKVREAGGGDTKVKGGLLVRAMMRLTGKDNAAIVAYINDLSKEEVAALRKNPRVQDAIAAIQAEQTKTDGIDSDSLLDGIMGTDDSADDSAKADADAAE